MAFSCVDCCFYCWVTAELWRAGRSSSGLLPESGTVCTSSQTIKVSLISKINMSCWLTSGWLHVLIFLYHVCTQMCTDTTLYLYVCTIQSIFPQTCEKGWGCLHCWWGSSRFWKGRQPFLGFPAARGRLYTRHCHYGQTDWERTSNVLRGDHQSSGWRLHVIWNGVL